ncbi:MAG TPA: flagellar biosynthesis anti-sigma factor FlgM [Paenalcaligenes sp.]|nr:flagellar biosynthesis anti-sigma factor FlgM [Paenalcaligenes sp.]
MKISPTPINPNQGTDKSSLRSAYGQRPQSSSTTPRDASSGTVQLSQTARALQQLQNDTQDIHTQRVQAIKEALQSGQLQIDPTAVADGLLESAKDLLK